MLERQPAHFPLFTMSKLSYKENKTIEEFLGMGGGFVLDFSDRTFAAFVGDVVGLDINGEKYKSAGTSKANKLRQFIKTEQDYTIGKLLKGFYEYNLDEHNKKEKDIDTALFEQFHKLAERLLSGSIIDHIDAIQANNEDKDFHQLARLIKESIEKNEPEAALDRLHVFLIKFLKELCDSHSVVYSKEETVNALYGKYIKAIKAKNFIESDMTEKIIQFSFQVIQAFNDIRNNKSFAHDNPVLNYDESVLIFSNVTATVKFIQSMETKHKNRVVEEAKPDWDLFK